MTATDSMAEARRTERALEETLQDAEKPAEVDLHLDRTRTFSSMSFSRMRTNWTSEDRDVIDVAKAQADREIMMEFGDAYRLLANLYEIVREPELGPGGIPEKDRYGFPKWKKDATGMHVEDWSRLTERGKEDFLFGITTRLVLWEQKVAEWWGEAMFAKGIWEDRFASSFRDTAAMESKRPTVDDRTQHAQYDARDQRYFAIYMSMRSKQAEALVKSLERLAQRIKDTIR
jgi:hypothetical protein